MSKLNLIDLNSFAEECDTFFETGACFGEGIDYANQFNFKKIISVEIEDKKIPFLKDKYKNIEKIKIIHSTSLKAFESELKNINSNIVFWLDAHYPDLIYGEYANPNSKEYESIVRMPLEQELLFIKENRNNYKDIIIIDDLNCFINNGERMPDWLKPKVKFEEGFYKKILSTTHRFIQINAQETVGILLPI